MPFLDQDGISIFPITSFDDDIHARDYILLEMGKHWHIVRNPFPDGIYNKPTFVVQFNEEYGAQEERDIQRCTNPVFVCSLASCGSDHCHDPCGVCCCKVWMKIDWYKERYSKPAWKLSAHNISLHRLTPSEDCSPFKWAIYYFEWAIDISITSDISIYALPSACDSCFPITKIPTWHTTHFNISRPTEAKKPCYRSSPNSSTLLVTTGYRDW